MSSRYHETTHVWRASDLQRRYRQVLDSATEEPTLILDGDHAYMVEPADDAQLRMMIVARLRDLAQFLAAHQQFGDAPPADWAALTPFPWVAGLSADEVDEFQRELLGSLVTAAHSNSTTSVDGILAAWQSTAEIYADPGLLDLLTAPMPESLHEVLPPAIPSS
jgi:hypothetical protein